jgi:cell growth-regulating nucleolar protein
MVSFQCQRCSDVVKKPKVVRHASSCGSGWFSCVDCMEAFDLKTIQAHTSCLTEVEKYQGKWIPKASSSNPRTLATAGENGGVAAAKPKRPLMRLSSDSDDDDWVKQPAKAPGAVGSDTSAPKRKIAIAAKYRVNNGFADSSEDDDAIRDDGHHPHKRQCCERAASIEEEKAANACAPPRGHKQPAPEEAKEAGVHVNVYLGPAKTVCDVVEGILDETPSMPTKALMHAVVERYKKRLANNMKSAVLEILKGSRAFTLSDDGAEIFRRSD